MSLAYGILSMIALIQIGICIVVDRKKEIWLLLLFVSVFICNIGYFLLSVSKTLEMALMANRIAYFGNVFLPFFMAMIFLNLCKINYRKWLPAVLLIVSLLIFAIAASPGYLTVYYKSVSIEIVNGAAKLVREYGPLHSLYYIYLFLYLASMFSAVGYSIAKKKIASHIYGIFLLLTVFMNLMVWLIEQFLPRGFEFLSLSYLLSEALLLFLYGVFQEYNMKQRIICVWSMAFVGVGIAMLCRTAPSGNTGYYFLNMIRSFIYIGIYYAWGRTVCRGVTQKTQRLCQSGISMLLVFWIVVSTCKHLIFQNNVNVVRYLWYAYYIPQILSSVFGLIIVLMVGKGENARPGKWNLMLFGSGVALILLVLTNDFHQLVFSFPEGMPWTNAVCTHEFGYYMIMSLIVLCCVGIIVLFVAKCRVPGRKKLTGFPIMCLVALVAYIVLYFVEGSIVNIYLNDMSVVGCVMIAALSESFVESGLFRTNIGYDNLFQCSTLAVQITDHAHRVHYTSENARRVPVEIMEEADRAPVILEQSVKLSGAAICSGHIYWQEDVSELLLIQKELELTQEELHDTGDVLKALAEQKAHWLRLKGQNRLYDMLEKQTAPQVAMLRELMAQLRQTDDLHTAKRLLGKIVIIGTYIKRRSNLIFVAGQEGSIRTAELLLCMNESAENLKLYGVECRVRISGCERFSPETANTVYDLFEAVIEKSLDTVSAILLYMEPENGALLLNICADGAGDMQSLCQSFPSVRVRKDEDGLWYLNMTLEEGGGGV